MSLPSTDKDGFLTDPTSWTPEIAKVLAEQDQLELTDAHWEVIQVLRRFYEEHDLAPAMRIFVKAVRTSLGDDKGNSIYLMQLFPGSPAKRACRIAGLPRPTNCL
ncbi:TusE/DsrC/DsvC family sulfur relay protein [Mangrovitalea sediminis]|uniref:TusE/DsrC/DsvC family sulfur relay protein n=1 Tax=Mangrovitalea sediminis TaxID=1982043 RepID=UPI000BE4D113|nr:TusE/DsrC/DsvC family sulfur relay protein [Mangrovitalea sediminis]